MTNPIRKISGPLQKVFIIGGAADEPVTIRTATVEPEDFVYQYLMRVSGPQAASGEDYDMNTNSAATPTIFEYTVPDGRGFEFSRLNIVLVDNSINPGDFGGINGGLTNGCLFEVWNSDGAVRLQSFATDVTPMQANDDFVPLAGSDVPISALSGDDLLPIRFSVFKASEGRNMNLEAGETIRWTNRDNLSSISKFRIMVQGTLI